MSVAIEWQTLSLQLVITFAHFLWQAVSVGAILAVSLWLASNAEAKTRYALASLAYLALPICVVVTFATVCLSGDPIVVSEQRGTIDVNTSIAPPQSDVKTTGVLIQESVDLGTAEPIAASSLAAPANEIETSGEQVAAWDEIVRIWSPYLLSVYCLGVIVLLSRTAMATWSGRRLRWSTQPIADSKYLGLIAEQARRMGFVRAPLVAICKRVSVPVVVGVLKPTILLPPALLCGLDANQVAAVLRHEMAHIRRYDPLVNLLQRFVESLLFFHPVTWWISRRISTERENCCDDLASVDCGSFQYAEALLQMAELCAAARGMQVTPQLGAIAADGGNASQLSCRIHRLLGEPISPRLAVTRTSWSITLGSVLVCCLSVFAVAQNGEFSPPQVATEGGDQSDAVPVEKPVPPQPDEDGIYWSGRDKDGWIAGMRIIERPSADSPVLVVGHLLRNASDETRRVDLSIHGRSRSTVDISAGNRIRADLSGGSWMEEPTAAANQILQPDHWQTRFNFDGLEPGEYSVRFGSAFFIPVKDQIGTRSSIPFGLTLPINITRSGSVAAITEDIDANRRSKLSFAELPIRWGEPVSGLRIGVVFLDTPQAGDKRFRHGELAQAQLFVQNVSEQSVQCRFMLPHPMDGWGLNIEDVKGNSVRHHQVFFSMFSPLRLFSAELATNEIQPISGKLPKFREGNEDEGYVPDLSHVEFRIADVMPEQAEHSPPFTYGMPEGRYNARCFANLRREDIPDADLSVETGWVGFQVGDADAVQEVARSDTRLTVSAIDEKTEKPRSDVYLTLWRALSAGQRDPVNTVNGSSGFGYYNPVIWEDRENDARWVRAGSAHPNDGRHGWNAEQFHFNSLGPGRYRLTAVPYRPKEATADPTPCGASEAFRCDGKQPAAIDLKLLSGDAAMTLRLVDAQSRQPIARIGIRLRDQSGMPIVHGHGSGNFFERTDDMGEVRFGSLQPGNYSVEVLGKHASVNQFVEYAPIAEWAQMKVESGADTTEIAVTPRQLPEQEISERFPFSAFGRVTDPDGKPLADVEIRAATGRGTLRGGGTVKTDADGRYRLYFGPGIRTQVGENSPLGVGVQAAHFFANKAGWELGGEPSDYELLMSDRSREQLLKQIEKDGPVWGRTDTTDVIFAGKPRELHFVVKPVAQDDTQQVATTAEPAKVDANAERPEAKYPYCVIEIEDLETRSLADAIAAFNEQSMESPVGRFQPAVTESETLEAIKSFSAQSQLPASAKSTLQQIVATKKLPPTAYFRRFTRFDDGQLMHRVWWVRLVITGDDPPVRSVPVRAKVFTSRSYTQMERQQHASGGLTLINRFSSYFEVPPNILLLAEFPQDAKNRLIADAKAAIAGDADALQRVFQWEGVSKSTRQFVATELQQLRQAKIESIEIRPRNFKAKMVHWSAYQSYQPNLPIAGYLDVTYKPAASDPGPVRTLSLEMGRSGGELRLVNYVTLGERKLPSPLIKGLSISGQLEPLADGTYLMSTITRNPGTLLSAHLGNEEIWQREF
jgi:beta-lactamase regulating signal transducer with metallopeptidase domain